MILFLLSVSYHYTEGWIELKKKGAERRRKRKGVVEEVEVVEVEEAIDLINQLLPLLSSRLQNPSSAFFLR